MIIYLITFGLTLFYIVFLFWSLNNWLKIRDKSQDDLKVKNIKVAIVIAARNEEANLPILLQSLIIQSYPKDNFQIIVSDDHSTDNTIKITETNKKDGKEVKEEIVVFKDGKNLVGVKHPDEDIVKTIYFEIDSVAISADGQKVLNNVLQFLLEHQHSNIALSGYACVIGKE